MEKALQDKFTNLRTYIGKGIDSPDKTIHFSVTILGLNAMVLGNTKYSTYIETYTLDKKSYIIYSSDNLPKTTLFKCGVDDTNPIQNQTNVKSKIQKAGDGYRRIVTLAIATTGEYSQYQIIKNGKTDATTEEKKEVVLSSIFETMKNINAIYIRDVALKMILVSSTDIIYLDHK